MVENTSVYRVLLSAPQTGSRTSVGTDDAAAEVEDDELDSELEVVVDAPEVLDTTDSVVELDPTADVTEVVGLGPGMLLTYVTTGV